MAHTAVAQVGEVGVRELQFFSQRHCRSQCSHLRLPSYQSHRFLDNIFVELLWRTLKYECVYLHAWENGSQARAGIRKWMEFYNNTRPHSALGCKPPAVIYWQAVDQHQPDQQAQRVA